MYCVLQSDLHFYYRFFFHFISYLFFIPLGCRVETFSLFYIPSLMRRPRPYLNFKKQTNKHPFWCFILLQLLKFLFASPFRNRSRITFYLVQKYTCTMCMYIAHCCQLSRRCRTIPVALSNVSSIDSCAFDLGDFREKGR